MKINSTGPLAALLAIIVFPGLLEAQGMQQSWSVWAGGAMDEFETQRPLSPQVGLRFEIAPEEHVRLGLEASTRFVDDTEPCRGDLCATGQGLASVLGLNMRLEAGAGSWRPYVLVAGGRAFHWSGSSVALGLGTGVRIPDAWSTRDLSLELRYERDGRYSTTNEHLIVVFGLGF